MICPLRATKCCVCTLQLNSSSHIARSHHHLFPVPSFQELRLGQGGSGSEGPGPGGDGGSRARGGSGTWLLSTVESPGSPSAEGEAEGGGEGGVSQLSSDQLFCAGCLLSLVEADGSGGGEDRAVFKCLDCKSLFCADCDSFIHDSLHNCPNCNTELK